VSNHYSLEKAMKIYNDDLGDCIEVTEDKDGLGLVEICYRDEQGKIGEPEMVPLIIKALTEVAESIGAKP
jgi:hypothetical protein